MCISMATKVPELSNCRNRGQNLVSEVVLDETLVVESAVDQTLGGDEPAVGTDEEVLVQIMDDKSEPRFGLGCNDWDQTLVSETALDKTLVAEWMIDQTLVGEHIVDEIMGDKSEPRSGQGCDNQDQILVSEPVLEGSLVAESALDQILVSKLPRDETLVAKLAVDQTLGGAEPPLDHTLTDEQTVDQIRDDDLEAGFEQGCQETSSDSSFNSIGSAEEEEALVEKEFGLPFCHDDELPEEVDDVGNDKMEFFYMNGMPPHMWRPMRRYQFEPQFVPHQMWDMRCRWGYHPCGPYLWDLNQGPSSRWLPRHHKKESTEEANSFSLFQSELGEVDSSMVGAGLWNLGNTCFLNAILQCFTHTVPLIEGLRSYHHPKPCERDREGFCVFCALHGHIELAISSKGKSLSPLKIVENLNQLSSDFWRHQQEDAHELLQCLLDKLDRCCNNLATDDSNGNLVHRLFGGRLISKLKCCNCDHCSDTFEPLIDLSLEIDNISSLTSALESFTKVEKIEDEEPQFTCESCKEKVTVEKQLMVDHAPSIAAFHLKRFKNDGSCVEKIDKHVEFPLEIDLKPYTSGSQDNSGDLSYNLYAIVVHAGFSPTSGHYFCFIRSAPDAWYRLDDSQVTRVSEYHVLSWEAYILFYAKNGTPWFTTFMETEKIHLDSFVTNTSPKSVLETANQSSKSFPSGESNIISEVFEADRREAMGIPGLSFECPTQGVPKSKNDSKFEKKTSLSPCRGDVSVTSTSLQTSVLDMDGNSESSSRMIVDDVNEKDRRDAVETSGLSSDDCRCKGEEDEAKDDFDNMMTLSSNACIGGNLSVSNDSPKLVIDDTDHIAESSSIMETNISSDVNEEDRDDATGITRLHFNNFGHKNELNDAKDDFKIETKLSSAVVRGGNTNQRDGEFTKSADFNYSTSQRSSGPILISGLSFGECTREDGVDASKEDSKMEKKLLPSALKSEVGKSASDNSSTFSGLIFSAKPSSILTDHPMKQREPTCNRELSDDRQRKEAYKLVKVMPCSRRRSQLMAAMNNNREVCLKAKRSKINEQSSSRKDGPSNALRSPNLASLSCPVAP